jgi:hypothetical protein
LLYAVLAHRHGASNLRTITAPPRETVIVNSTPSPTHDIVAKPLPAFTNVEAQLLQAKAREIGELRAEIDALEGAMTQLSKTVVQQRTLLGETNRIKFYQLAPASAGAGNPDARLSPGLQRAVFISIGRELGWLPADLTPGAETGNDATPVNFGGVDFVTLRSDHNATANVNPTANANPNPNPIVNANPSANANQPPVPPPAEPQPSDTPAPTTIPAFVSGDNLIVAVDPTVVPANSYLTFTASSANQVVMGGTVAFGDNPMVVTIPLSAGSLSTGGFMVTISSVTTSGLSNVTQFFAPTTQ